MRAQATQSDPADDARRLTRSLVRFNAHVLGTTAALLAAVGLFGATVVLVAQDGGDPGPMLGQLRYFLPGYTVSPGGAVVGAAFAAPYGYAGGALLGLLYGPWLLRAPTRRAKGRATRGAAPVARLNPLPLALATGGLLAAGLVVATVWLDWRHEEPSRYLALLVHYLPGYKPTAARSLVGAASLFVYGFAAAGALALVYNRVADWRQG